MGDLQDATMSNSNANGDTPKIMMPCPECTTMLNIDQPILQIVNHPIASIIHIIHEKGVDCYRCGNYFTLFCPAVQNGNILLQLMPTIKPKEANKIIEPPKGLKIVKH